MLFVARKNRRSLKTKNSIKKYSTMLVIFEMISLKWTKSLTIFLLTGDKFMREMHLKQPGFTNRAYGLSIY